MAERRMYAKTIVLSDAFLDMPMSARCLYFTLGMLADDDGFVNAPRSIMRQCGSSDDDMRILISKKFVIIFETGVIVIKHWRINNYLRNDRYVETKYVEEKARLTIDENGAYHLANPAGIPGGIPTGIPSSGIPSIGKDSIGKDSIGQDKGECEGEKTKKKKSRIKETDNPMFNRFYEAYPKHMDGDYAKKVFERINPDEALLETMLKAIERQKKTKQWQDVQYIPNPSTWLNKKKWKDEITDDSLVGHGNNSQAVQSRNAAKFDYGTEADYDEYGFPIGK